MRAWFRKAGFVLRYLWAKLRHYPRLELDGFVFLEPDVTITIGPAARVRLGRRAYLKKGCILECTGRGCLEVAERASIGHYAFVGCRESVRIGRYSLVGQACTLIDVKHRFGRDETFAAADAYGDGHCHIGDNCVVFPHATVGPDVTVADGSFILSHAAVVRDIEEGGFLWGGAPARRIKEAPGG
ncbi:MAG: hypothetical protein LIP77_05400 [Planctomycetes bacterium]|nr:hypothetical protein [Planctomycetota bacterium]